MKNKSLIVFAFVITLAVIFFACRKEFEREILEYKPVQLLNKELKLNAFTGSSLDNSNLILNKEVPVFFKIDITAGDNRVSQLSFVSTGDGIFLNKNKQPFSSNNKLKLSDSFFYYMPTKTGKNNVKLVVYDIRNIAIDSLNSVVNVGDANIKIFLPVKYSEYQRIIGEKNDIIFSVISSTGSLKTNTSLSVGGTSIEVNLPKLAPSNGRTDMSFYSLQPISSEKITPKEIKELRNYLLSQKSSSTARTLTDTSILTNVGDLYVSKYKVPYTAVSVGASPLIFSSSIAEKTSSEKVEDSIIVTSAKFNLSAITQTSFVGERKDLSYTISFADKKLLNQNVTFDFLVECPILDLMNINTYYANTITESNKRTLVKIPSSSFVLDPITKIYNYNGIINYSLNNNDKRTIKLTAIASTSVTDFSSISKDLQASTVVLNSTMSLERSYGYKDENAKIILSYIDPNIYAYNQKFSYTLKTDDVTNQTLFNSSLPNLWSDFVMAKDFVLTNGIYTKEIPFTYNLRLPNTTNSTNFILNVSATSGEIFPLTMPFQLANVEGISYSINLSETLGQLDEELNYTIRFSDVNLFNNNTPFQLILTARDNDVLFKNSLSSPSSSIRTITIPVVTGQSFSKQADNSYLYSGKIYYNLLSATNVLSSKLVVNSNKNFANADVNLTAVNSNVDVVLSTFKSATPYPLEPDTLFSILSYSNNSIRTKNLTYDFSTNISSSDVAKVEFFSAGGQYQPFENGGNYENGHILSVNANSFNLNQSNGKYEYVFKIPYKAKGENSFVFNTNVKRSTNLIYSSEPQITINPIQTEVGFNPISLDGWQPNALVSDWNELYLSNKTKTKIIDVNKYALYDLKYSSKLSPEFTISSGFRFVHGESSTNQFTNNEYRNISSLFLKNNQNQPLALSITTPSASVGRHKITITAKRIYDGREFVKDTFLTISGYPQNLSYATPSFTSNFGFSASSVAPSVTWNGIVGTFSLVSSPNSGIWIDATTGVISWTNAVPVGTYSLTVKAVNSSSTSDASTYATTNYTLNINSVQHSNLTYTVNSSDTIFTVGTASSKAINTINRGGNVIAYSVSGNPSGVTINSSTGEISWTNSVVANNYPLVVTATATGRSNITQNVFLSIRYAPSSFSYSSNLTTSLSASGSSVSPTISANNSPITNYSALLITNDPLPNGVTINSTSGVISWTNSVPVGNYTIIVTATNAIGVKTSSYTLIVVGSPVFSYADTSATEYAVGFRNFAMTTSPINRIKIKKGTVGNSSMPIVNWNAFGGSFTSSALPSGVFLNSVTGVISWSNSVSVGNYPIIVAATNGQVSLNTSKTFNLEIIDVPTANYLKLVDTTYYNNLESSLPVINWNNGKEDTLITKISFTSSFLDVNLSNGKIFWTMDIPQGGNEIVFEYKNFAGKKSYTYVLRSILKNPVLQVYSPHILQSEPIQYVQSEGYTRYQCNVRLQAYSCYMYGTTISGPERTVIESNSCSALENTYSDPCGTKTYISKIDGAAINVPAVYGYYYNNEIDTLNFRIIQNSALVSTLKPLKLEYKGKTYNITNPQTNKFFIPLSDRILTKVFGNGSSLNPQPSFSITDLKISGDFSNTIFFSNILGTTP